MFLMFRCFFRACFVFSLLIRLSRTAFEFKETQTNWGLKSCLKLVNKLIKIGGLSFLQFPAVVNEDCDDPSSSESGWNVHLRPLYTSKNTSIFSGWTQFAVRTCPTSRLDPLPTITYSATLRCESFRSVTYLCCWFIKPANWYGLIAWAWRQNRAIND